MENTPFIRTYWPQNQARVEALAKDGLGSYVLPFPVRRSPDGKFRNAKTGDVVSVQIVGWRHARTKAKP